MKKYFLFIFLFFSPQILAEKYYQLRYKVKPGENFSMVLKKFVKFDAIVNLKSPSVQKIMKSNPQVENWRSLQPGTDLELFIEDSIIDMNRYKQYEDDMLKKIAGMEEKLIEAKKRSGNPTGLKGSIFYMASYGLFSQDKSTIASIKFYQNSPMTLGTAMTYYPQDSNLSYSGSAYYSALLASGSNLGAKKVSIPAEIGANAYLEYKWQSKNITFYGGPDYETFSTFNMDSLQEGSEIVVDKTAAIYATFGAAKSFSIFQKNIFMKASISKTISTTTTVGEGATADVDKTSYSGMKFLFYLNYKFSEKFYVHSLFKYHSMTGPSDLSTLRIGVGLGYVLF